MKKGHQLLEAISQAADAGGSLPVALRAMVGESTGQYRRTLCRLANGLESGRSLDELLQDRGLRLGRYTITAVRAGFESGRLAAVLTEVIEQQRATNLARKRLIRTFAYPCIVLCFAMGIAIFATFIVVPPFRLLITDFELQVPEATLRVFWWAERGWKLFAAGVASVAVAFALFRVFAGAAQWRWLLSTIPVFGTPFWWASTAEFARLLKVLLREKVTLSDALELTADSLSDANVATYSRQAAVAVREGRSFASTLTGNIRIPTSIQPLIDWGEVHDCLPDAMELIAEIFDGRMELRSRLLDTVFPPVLFLVIGSMALAIVIALFLPMISLVQVFS